MSTKNGGAGALENERSECVFGDFKEPLNAMQAKIEAERCLFCSDAPCVRACPTEIDIPQFIRKIATGNVRGSAKTIFESNVLGTSCARVCPVEVLCVGDCVHNEAGVPPIQIGKLQRFATDTALEQGWRFAEAGKPTGKKIALVGGGPASLACAHELRRLGHATTIFEKGNVLGGLNTTGVAPYKMRADRSVEEIEWLLGIGGIEIKSNVRVGKDVTFADLEKDYDAIFVGLGLGADSKLGVPGEDLPGVHGAVDWIEKMKLGKVDMGGVRSAIVVGGGNTAIDCVRELLGLIGDGGAAAGATVTMVYRGDHAGMSGYHHEWDAAGTEGARALWRRQPLEIRGNGRASRMKVAVLDEKKKPVAGQEHEIDADLILVAIGQAKLGEMLGGLDGVKLDRGRIVVDAEQSMGRPKYWAGGDCANGGKEVVNAAAEGRRAARSIDRFLGGKAHG